MAANLPAPASTAASSSSSHVPAQLVAAVALGAVACWCAYDALQCHDHEAASSSGLGGAEHALLRQPSALGLTGCAVGAVLLSRSSRGIALSSGLGPVLSQLLRLPWVAASSLTNSSTAIATTLTAPMHSLWAQIAKAATSATTCSTAAILQSVAWLSSSSSSRSAKQSKGLQACDDDDVDDDAVSSSTCSSRCSKSCSLGAAASATSATSANAKASTATSSNTPSTLHRRRTSATSRPQGQQHQSLRLSIAAQARSAPAAALNAACTLYAVTTGFLLYAALCLCLATVALLCVAARKAAQALSATRLRARHLWAQAGESRGQGRAGASHRAPRCAAHATAAGHATAAAVAARRGVAGHARLAIAGVAGPDGRHDRC